MKDHAEAALECPAILGLYIHAAHPDHALVCVIQPQQQGGQCALAAAGGPQDSQHPALAQEEGRRLHIRPGTLIGECDAVHAQKTAASRQGRCLPLLLRGQQDLLDPAGGCGALADLHEHLGKPQCGALDQSEVGHKGDDLPGGHQSRVDPQGPHQDYQDEPGVQQQIGYGGCQRHDLPGLRLCLPLGLVGCVKAIPLPDLTGEGLYHPHPGGVLPEDAYHRVHSRLSSGVVGDPPPGHQRNGEKGEKAHRQLHQRQRGLQQKGQYQSAQHQHGGPDAAPLDLVKHLVDIVGVIGEAGHQGGG